MFEKYDTILYPFRKGKDKIWKYVKDISTHLNIRDEEGLTDFYEEYVMGEGETPETVAYKVYGNPKLHYLIMLANNRFDWRKDFPLNNRELESYIKEIYAKPFGVHHYVDVRTGIILQEKPEEDAEFIVPITNSEYEVAENEKKRKIRLIRKKYATAVARSLEGLLEK